MTTAQQAARRTVTVAQYGPSGRSPWLDMDWSAHQRWVQVQGVPMNVIDLGPQEAQPAGTIVWIHGLSGSWQNWLENLPIFARTHRCIAMDLPGFGASPMPLEKISISGYARTVDALLSELGVERAVVVGNSMGGFIGAELAIAFGTWVDRLVLVSAAGLSIEFERDERRLRALRLTETAAAGATRWVAARSDHMARRRRWRKMMFYLVATHPELLPPPLAAEQVRGSGTPGFIDALDALTSYPIRHRLPEIAAPTLVVWGENDALVPVRDAWEFGELIPDAQVVVYEDTGHIAMLERPDAFNALVGDFLAA